MTFPATMADMLRGGYVFLKTKQCRDCRETHLDVPNAAGSESSIRKNAARPIRFALCGLPGGHADSARAGHRPGRTVSDTLKSE